MGSLEKGLALLLITMFLSLVSLLLSSTWDRRMVEVMVTCPFIIKAQLLGKGLWIQTGI